MAVLYFREYIKFSSQRLKLFFLVAHLIAAIGSCALKAQSSVNTEPQGYTTVAIAAGTGTSSSMTFLSLPLREVATASGAMKGVVTSFDSKTITNSNAGWAAGELSQASTPYLIEFTSGAAAGRIFLISTSTANTATRLTIDLSDSNTTDLATLGLVANSDTYQIIPADTISSIFGTPPTTGVVGGTSANNVDKIQLYSAASGWTTYYYNTTSGWIQVGPAMASGNVVIRPDTGVMYLRYAASPMTLTLTGAVPSAPRQALTNNTGITVLSNYWPVDMTLGTSNIRNIPGWVSGTYPNVDTVQIYTAGSGWKTYYHNNANWVQVGPPIVSNSVSIPTGSAVLLIKRTPSSGYSLLKQSTPYSLD